MDEKVKELEEKEEIENEVEERIKKDVDRVKKDTLPTNWTKYIVDCSHLLSHISTLTKERDELQGRVKELEDDLSLYKMSSEFVINGYKEEVEKLRTRMKELEEKQRWLDEECCY